MPRLSKTSCSSKSPPTTATILTLVKKLAEIEKCDAEPPSILSHLPKGVSTASYATDPTTRRDMILTLPLTGFQDFKIIVTLAPRARAVPHALAWQMGSSDS